MSTKKTDFGSGAWCRRGVQSEVKICRDLRDLLIWEISLSTPERPFTWSGGLAVRGCVRSWRGWPPPAVPRPTRSTTSTTRPPFPSGRVDRVPEGASGAVLLALGSCRPRARRATAGGGVPGVDATDEKREDGVDVEVSGLPDDVIVDCFIIGKGSKEKVNKCEFAGTQRTAVPLEPLETAVATRGKSHRDRLPIHQP